MILVSKLLKYIIQFKQNEWLQSIIFLVITTTFITYFYQLLRLFLPMILVIYNQFLRLSQAV